MVLADEVGGIKRENGENPLRGRRCNRSDSDSMPLRKREGESAVAKNREPEDLPFESTFGASAPGIRNGRVRSARAGAAPFTGPLSHFLPGPAERNPKCVVFLVPRLR
jgi:hypothetical protein